jgi:hypothetical protein
MDENPWVGVGGSYDKGMVRVQGLETGVISEARSPDHKPRRELYA